jgi:hypothetical protein
MVELPRTDDNIDLIQEFLNETNKRIAEGATLTFNGRSNDQLNELALLHDISVGDILGAIQNLTPENYHRGVDPSNRGDFNICAFCTTVGVDNIEIYLKYGLEINGLQILVFSSHPPERPMSQPFKN